MFVDVPRVLGDLCTLCEVSIKLVGHCIMFIIHNGSAGGETGERAGESELVLALLYFLCESLTN